MRCKNKMDKTNRKEEATAIAQVMCELDEKIWNTYYPDDDTDGLKPDLNTVYDWLSNSFFGVE